MGDTERETKREDVKGWKMTERKSKGWTERMRVEKWLTDSERRERIEF